MKRKLWMILSLVLVLSIAFGSTALAANPNTYSFNFQSHNGKMQVYCAAPDSNGEGYGVIYTDWSSSETYVMSETCYYRYLGTDGLTHTVYASVGGQNFPGSSLLVYHYNVHTSIYAQNKTIIFDRSLAFYRGDA